MVDGDYHALASAITTWKTETSIGFDLAYLTSETCGTLAREARVAWYTCAIVATWLTQAQVQLVLASQPEEVCRAEASEAVWQTQTSRSVETRVGQTVVNGRLAIGAREAGDARAIHGAVECGAAKGAILANARIAQVDKRVASSARVPVGTHTFESVRQ